MAKKIKNRKFYIRPYAEYNELLRERRQMQEQQQVLERAGLDREASIIEQHIREKSEAIKQKADEVSRARDQLVRHMLLAFAAGDIATTCADLLAETFDELTYGEDRTGGNQLAELFRNQAEEWNRCVQMVDGDSEHGNERVSMYYSEIAEEICDTVIPQIRDIINRHMNTEKGKRLL